MTNPDKAIKDRAVLSVEEVDSMLDKASQLPSVYFQLRAKALIALLKKFGKRRIEVSRLQPSDLRIVGSDLEITFNLAKKHKKGLFQYLRYLQKTDPEQLKKPLPEIQTAWRQWQETEQGHRTKTSTSLQSIALDDKYAHYILDYLQYLREKYPDAKFLFPSGLSVFGTSYPYLVFPDRSLSGRQLLRIIKQLNPDAWTHLFRYTKGCEVAREHGRTIDSVHYVRDTLDLENEATAWIYVRRSVPARMTKEST